MSKTIIAIVAILFSISFYSFLFSGGKGAAENIKNDISITTVDKVCRHQKELCEEL